MNDSHEQFEKIESSPKRREHTVLVISTDSRPIAAMLTHELANRSRQTLSGNAFAVTLDLVAPIPEITISEMEIEPDTTVLLERLPLRELPADIATLEAFVEKPIFTSWKGDKLGSQVSDYGPPARKASVLRNRARKGRK